MLTNADISIWQFGSCIIPERKTRWKWIFVQRVLCVRLSVCYSWGGNVLNCERTAAIQKTISFKPRLHQKWFQGSEAPLQLSRRKSTEEARFSSERWEFLWLPVCLMTSASIQRWDNDPQRSETIHHLDKLASWSGLKNSDVRVDSWLQMIFRNLKEWNIFTKHESPSRSFIFNWLILSRPYW